MSHSRAAGYGPLADAFNGVAQGTDDDAIGDSEPPESVPPKVNVSDSSQHANSADEQESESSSQIQDQSDSTVGPSESTRISKSANAIVKRLESTPNLRRRSAQNLGSRARSYLDCLGEDAQDRWSDVSIEAHEGYCLGNWTNPNTGKAPSTSRGSINVRRSAANAAVRVARDLGLLAADSELLLHVEPPIIVDPVSLLPLDHPERIRQKIAQWQPRAALASDEEEAEELLALVRQWVTDAEPPNASSAGSWLRCVADQLLWAVDELGTTDLAFVLHPANVESGTEDRSHIYKDSWYANSRSILRRISRALCPEVAPDEPKVVGVQAASEPYDAVDEYLFREAALMERQSKRERLWMTAALLGAGLSGTEAFKASPSHLVELDGDRLGIKVHRGRERIIPIRAQYTDLAAEARELCVQQDTFFASKSEAAAYNIAAKFRVQGLGRIYIARARATYVCAHIESGTSAKDLDEICGPIGGTYLRQLLDRVVDTVDPLEAANRGLGP